MIERLIYKALTTGIAQVTADPALIDDLFQTQHGLEPSETSKIRGYFEDKPPNVIHGYARPDSNFPLYAITLGAENTADQLLGNEGGFDDVLGADYTAQFFDATYNVLVYAQHPDVTLYYYQLAKFFLLSNIDFFTKCGLFNIRFGGSDMAPDPTWVPAGLFLRRLSMMANEEYTQIDESSKLGRAFKIGGVHITAAGAIGEDVGGVKTLVDPIDVLGED